ncbi:fructokinase [Candidatus Cyanaurora vandensis]|uniref:fructokinase n=1 Tax=Candidatus Cyanaurora vandensis TaxID=2714958 RepID=UPI00257ED2D6|nr:fructokinase [Candidatus Cyanaurora vandensis]
MRIGVDLGGTKIEALALNEQGQELFRRRVSTPQQDYPGTVQAVADLVRSLEVELGQVGTVGVAMPGTLSRSTGHVKNANSVWLNGQPFDHDLSSALQRPIRLSNDANCFALSEASDGAAVGVGVVFGVILGTGTGGGIVVGGQVLTGPNGIAGEWGHNPLPWPTNQEWPGPPCYCGKTGCIETFLSGPGFARDYHETGGEALTGPEIVQRSEQGETLAELTLVRYQSRLARALASVINILDPDVIVLGGGMSNITRLYTQIPYLWGPYVFSDRVDTRLAPAKHGDASGVRGAAWLWPT